jgi:hypothetical protein
MTCTALFIPMKVDGLFVKTARRGVGPLTDFTRLPFIAGRQGGATWDANSENPWITDTVASEPMTSGERPIDAGVHLHWAMPDALTKATHPLGTDGKPDQSQVKFPTLPNRWLVTRKALGVIQKRWIIESDYLWPVDYDWGRINKVDFVEALNKSLEDNGVKITARGTTTVANLIWGHLLKIGWVNALTDDAAGMIAEQDARISNDLGDYKKYRAKIVKTLHEIGHAPRRLERQLTTVPMDNVDKNGFPIPGQPPFRYMGRSRELTATWPQTEKPEYLSHHKDRRLTAVGHGDPTFAAFYPNCRSVFGFHDEVDASAGQYEYDVLGWFSDHEDDPVKNHTNDEHGDLDEWLIKSKKWTISDTSKFHKPDGAVFYGRVHCTCFVPAAAAHIAADQAGQDNALSKDVQVAIGNTGTEAQSAFVAATMAHARHRQRISERKREKTKIESYLQALHLSDNLDHRRLDVGAKFVEARHNAGFVAQPGGHIWTIRAMGDTPESADASKRAGAVPAHLPAECAVALNALNAAQREYERARRSIDAMQWQVYSDWTRYMRYAYPRSEEALDMDASRDHHDVDVAVAYLRQGSIALYNSLLLRTGKLLFVDEKHVPGSEPARQGLKVVQLEMGSDAASLAGRVRDLVKDLRDALANHPKQQTQKLTGDIPKWQLETAPAPRFYQPNDPVVLLSGPSLEPTDRHGQDGALNDKGLLTCHVLDLSTPVSGKLDNNQVSIGAEELIVVAGKLMRLLADTGTPQVGIRRGKRRGGHPFLLEWEATLSPIRATSGVNVGPSRFSPDFVARNWHLGETDCTFTAESDIATRVEKSSVVRGRGFLSDHGDGLLKARLERYLSKRMSVYFEATKADYTDPSEPDPLNYLAQNYQAVRKYFVEAAVTSQAVVDGHALAALQAADPKDCVHGIANTGAVARAILTILNKVSPKTLVTLTFLDPQLVRMFVLRRAGAHFIKDNFLSDPSALNKALSALKIDAGLRSALQGKPEILAKFLCTEMDADTVIATLKVDPVLKRRLPDPSAGLAILASHLGTTRGGDADPATSTILAHAKLTNNLNDLSTVANLAPLRPDNGTKGAQLFAQILRYAHFNGFFGQEDDDTAMVEESPHLHGLPTDGPVEAAILKLVNENLEIDDPTLADQAKLPDFVIADLRLAGKQLSLVEMMARPLVDLSVLSKLFHAADRDHNYLHFEVDAAQAPAVGAQGGAQFAAKAPGGHAWSDPILTALDAWHQIMSGSATLTQALTGFNDGLLMKRHGWQLPVADPLGFLAYRAFSEKTIRRLVGESHSGPMTAAGFHPIRSGEMNLSRLRLVDNFGQITEIRTGDITAAEHMNSSNGAQVALAPRITQAARLNFRWLDAESGNQEWLQHPETSPICGWVVLNNLERRLMLHATSGAPLGSIDQTGTWRVPPGDRGGVTSPDSITNPSLRRLVKWMLTEAARLDTHRGDFIAGFLKLCETALENIDPEGAVHRQAQSLLMGRPMALVRAAVSLECRDPYAVDQGFETFGRELQGYPRSTSGFETVSFPVRIGEHMQLNDGVVAFWPEAGPEFAAQSYRLASMPELTSVLPDLHVSSLLPLAQRKFTDADQFRAEVARLAAGTITPADIETITRMSARTVPYAPQSDWVRNTKLQSNRDKKNALNLWMPLDSPGGPMHVSVLMDPRGSLHATCGVLPTKQLSIPPDDYVMALNAINISFLTAPILTKRKSVDIGLPDEAGWRWSWLSKHDGLWSELPQTPEIRRAAFEDAFGPNTGGQIWNRLVIAGWVLPDPAKPDRAYIAPTPKVGEPGVLRNGRKVSDLGPQAELAEQVLRVLELAAKSIGRMSTQAQFAEQELIEGWLLLSPRADRQVLAPLTDDEGEA